MEIPIVFLLIPFGVFVLIATIFVMFNFFHVAHFGLQSAKTTLVLFIYLFAFAGTLAICLLILASFDWSQTLYISNIFDINNWAVNL